MKILLAIRRFRYTRVAVLSPGYPIRLPNNYWRGVKKLILPNFHEYIAGNYFPPIAIKPVPDIENNKFWGVEWGIYATENIGAKVLIGEYACDVIQGSDLILCKKGDSIYRHSGGSTP